MNTPNSGKHTCIWRHKRRQQPQCRSSTRCQRATSKHNTHRRQQRARLLQLALDEHEAYDDIDRLAELRHPKWTTNSYTTLTQPWEQYYRQTSTKTHYTTDSDVNFYQKPQRATAVANYWASNAYARVVARRQKPPGGTRQ